MRNKDYFWQTKIKEWKKEIENELIAEFLEILKEHQEDIIYIKQRWSSITTRYLDQKIEAYYQEIKKWEERLK